MMVVIAVCCLAAGVLLGNGILPKDIIDFLTGHSEHVLYVLMFSVGISVGANKGVFQKLREHHVKILLIPIGVILGSIFGGVVQSVFRGKLTGQSDDCVGAWLVQSFWSSGDGACRCKNWYDCVSM